MKKNQSIFILSFSLLLLFCKNGFSQYFPNYDVELFKGTVPFNMPWVGGLNNPQFSEADLNNDGILDMVIFDRTGYKLMTFTNGGTSNTIDYHYAPKYEKNFPSMDSWSLLLDFNCDSIADIFTHTTLGIKVYKGYYNSDNELCFSLFKKYLKFQSQSGPLNLLVTGVDIPAFCDIDNDNDIDILTFESFGGGWIEYYQNQSQDLGYGCDSLNFVLAEHCWGLMFEPADTPTKWLNQSCPWRLEELITPPNQNNIDSRGGGSRHSGSTTLAFDNDGDGDKEVVIGDISFSDLVYLTNGGTSSSALMTSQDIFFPNYSVPADIPYFPAAFLLDIDNDGVKDITAAPNSENGQTDVTCSWFYKNIGTNNNGTFIYQTDSFLIRDMVDVGSGSAPVFVDLNNDGLTDMLVANRNTYGTNSTITYLENTGSDTLPVYKWMTGNWMNLSSLNLKSLYPAFGDLDNDGKKEMILGHMNGSFLYFENTGGGNNISDNFILINPNYFGIDSIGGFFTPLILDLNGDGLLDLVFGESNGSLNFCRNNGTLTSPDFSNVQSSLGNVIVSQGGSLVGFSVPCFLKLYNELTWTLLVGCEGGTIFQYNDIENNLTGTFNLVDSSFANIKVGSFSTPSMADLNNDGIPEIAIGNYRGGITIYDTSTIHNYSSIAGINADWIVEIFPNPATDIIKLTANHEIATAELFDAIGRKLLTVEINNLYEFQLNTAHLSPALYVIRITGTDGNSAIKFVKY